VRPRPKTDEAQALGVVNRVAHGGAALTKAKAARKMIFVFASIGPTNAQVAELADALDSGFSNLHPVH